MLDSLVSRCSWATRAEGIGERELIPLVYWAWRTVASEGVEERRRLGLGARGNPQVAGDSDIPDQHSLGEERPEGPVWIVDSAEQHEVARTPVRRVAEPGQFGDCLLYTSPSPRDRQKSR